MVLRIDTGRFLFSSGVTSYHRSFSREKRLTDRLILFTVYATFGCNSDAESARDFVVFNKYPCLLYQKIVRRICFEMNDFLDVNWFLTVFSRWFFWKFHRYGPKHVTYEKKKKEKNIMVARVPAIISRKQVVSINYIMVDWLSLLRGSTIDYWKAVKIIIGSREKLTISWMCQFVTRRLRKYSSSPFYFILLLWTTIM